MRYQILKLHFSGSVHFGEGLLETSAKTFCADTLFSALCHEAGDTAVIQEMVEAARSGQLAFSDAFPYDETAMYLPKPFLSIRSDAPDDGDSVRKKQFKKLSYIPLDLYGIYLDGQLSDEQCAVAVKAIGKLGSNALHSHVSLPRNERDEEAKPGPYNVGIFRFREGCGLWLILAADTEVRLETMIARMQMLGMSGIGGKRSTGCGRFTVETQALPKELEQRLVLGADAEQKITLSVSLPQEHELAQTLEGASYHLIRRSGFVVSDHFSPVKKNDLFVMQAGSCFRNAFFGDVYEVSDGGTHPVYRYAVPLFLQVR